MNRLFRSGAWLALITPLTLVLACKGENSVPSEPVEPDCSLVPSCLGGNGSGGTSNGGEGGEGGAAWSGSGPGGSPGAGGSTGGSAPNCEDVESLLDFSPLSVPGYEDAADFVFLPNGNLLFAERRGLIRELHLQDGQLSEIRRETFPDTILNKDACGLANLLLDPEFETNGLIYVSYCTSDTITRLSRITYNDTGLSDLQIIVETELEKGTGGWHRFGSMGFEPDGLTLWVFSGEQTQKLQAQDLSSKRGKLLRIAPERRPGRDGYQIPAGNMADPDVSDLGDEVDPAVFALGFRSPWRATKDHLGRLWIGDVGNAFAEEVNVVEHAGQNFGWATQEGPCNEDCEDFEDPVAWYGRSLDHPYAYDDPLTEPATKRAVWVGTMPLSDSGPERYCGLLDDVVPFGDFFTGWVRGLKLEMNGSVQSDRPLGHLPRVTSWRPGPDGFAYVLTLDGILWRAELHLPEPE